MAPNLSSAQAWHLAISGAFAVNGFYCKNPLYQLYAMDVVSYLPLSTLPQTLTLLSRPAQNLYGIVEKANTNTRLDTPSYLEVDELCAAFVVLFEPVINVSHENTQTRTPVPFLTLKCYN